MMEAGYECACITRSVMQIKGSATNTSFLECSGPLDNVTTTPEWLKNNLKKLKKGCFFLTIVISK